jgi:molybdenum cofactor biosynthesis protein MoaC
MKVSVRLFAQLRERCGDRVDVELADGATVADALEALGRERELADLLERMPVTVAVNREFADRAQRLTAGDELAVIPPVSGGAGDVRIRARVHARVTSERLDPAVLAESVGDPGAGAIVIFQGTTRNVDRLDYEAYEEMASERIDAILTECAERHGLLAATAEHRVGAVPLGETSVVVAVSAPHRAEAFAGAREAIDRIKAEAPIWKREVEGATGRWVEGQPPPKALAAVQPEADPAAPGREAEDAAGSDSVTHVDASGSARMVDVGSKDATERWARAQAMVRMSPATAAAVAAGDAPKGDVLGTARIAGIQAAKRTAELIPLAHPLPLTFVDVDGRIDEESGTVELDAEARTVARTGVELEAMTACTAAALTVYDMVKGLERGVAIERIELVAKAGGRSGEWRRESS